MNILSNNLSPRSKTSLCISVGAIVLAATHLAWPHLAIDGITLCLLVVAIVPWLAPVIKSLKLPGGFEVELQEVTLRAESAGLLADKPAPEEPSFLFLAIADKDPNLALAGLRIELEERLSRLAFSLAMPNDRPQGVGSLLRRLTQAKALSQQESAVFADLVNILNRAVHGAELDSRAADWAIEEGPRLLASLDRRILEGQRARTKGASELTEPGATQMGH